MAPLCKLTILMALMVTSAYAMDMGDENDSSRTNSVAHTQWAAPLKMVMIENPMPGKGYDMATKTINLCVGDELMWMWNTPEKADVMVVNAQNFKTCTAKGKMLIKKSSMSGRYIKFNSAGTRHYICTIPGRCKAGQKVKVVVKNC